MSFFRKLGRKTEHRMAMLKSMVTSLVRHDKINTTVTRAKELRRVADWMVTWAKKGYIGADAGRSAVGDGIKYRRLAGAWVKDRDMLQRLFDEMPVRFATRRGGYTRVVKTGFRQGDGSPMARIEWVEWDREEDRVVFEGLRDEKERARQAVRAEVQDALTRHRHGTSIENVKAIGKLVNRTNNKKDRKALRALHSELQSRVSLAEAYGVVGEGVEGVKAAVETNVGVGRSTGKQRKRARVLHRLSQLRLNESGLGTPVLGRELPDEYGVRKVKKNTFNKYGGRGMVPAPPAEDEQ